MSGAAGRYWGGWVRVQVRGRPPAPEALVSALAARGLRLYRVLREPDGLSFTLPLAAVRLLPELRRRYRVSVRFGDRGGLPFRLRDLGRRPFLPAGSAAAAVLGWWLAGHVWVVATPGLSGGERAQVLAAAAAAGLRPGVPAGAVEPRRVARRMLAALPRAAWVGVELHGVEATVRVLPLVPAPAAGLPPRLVARTGGTVTRVEVFMGRPAVRPGEAVRRGQTVIEGVPTGIGSGQETPARGEVWARVPLRAVVRQPLRATEWVPGPGLVRRYAVEWDGHRYPLPAPGPVPFVRWQAETVVRPWSWRGQPLAGAWITVLYRQMVPKTVRLPPQAAAARALARAEAELNRRLAEAAPASPRVVARERRILRGREAVEVRLTWVVEEQIAIGPGEGPAP
ncbi:MAG: sporulation protein YqfD [Firmicutes bacterium]|nr:sporulation protein YqfD [Bacillota bacterium]